LDKSFLIQLIGSAIAVAAMVGVAAWARIARPSPPLDEARARALLAEEFPGRRLDGLWLGSDGSGALARSGDDALVVCRMGDGHVARRLAWSEALAGRFERGKLSLELHDVAAPRAVIALAAWPPAEAGAC
jgi:hypothetical protein